MLDIKEYLKQTKTVLLTQDAFDELKQRASAQPELIRCRDCVYVSPNTKKGCELRRWRWFDGSEFMGGDDYCSRAERREE